MTAKINITFERDEWLTIYAALKRYQALEPEYAEESYDLAEVIRIILNDKNRMEVKQ